MAAGATANPNRSWLIAGALTVAIAALYVFIASRSSLWDVDEAKFSQAAVEMVRSGNYLYPTFEGKLRPDKPILVYWFMAGGIKMFGPTALGVRFFSALSTAGACLFTFAIGRRLLSDRAGLWAMGILATTVMLTIDGAAAIADPLLLVCLMAVMWLMLLALLDGPKPTHVAGMSVAIGAALLAKGPLGFLPVLSAGGIALLLDRGRKPGKKFWLGLVAAVAIGTAMFLAWAIPANIATGGEFLKKGIGEHVLGRAVRPMEGHGGRTPLTYVALLPAYFPILLAIFFPWTLLLPGALSALWGKRIASRVDGGQLRAIVLGWSIPTFIIMSFVATKLPHYITPILPALALAVAGLIETEKASFFPRDRLWLKIGLWFFGISASLVALVLLVIVPCALLATIPMMHFGIAGGGAGPRNAWFDQWVPSLRFGTVTAGVILALMIGGAGRAVWRQQYQKAAGAVLIGAVLFQLAGAGLIIPAAEPMLKFSPRIAAAIRAKTGADVPFYEADYQRPTLTFYMGHGPAGRFSYDPESHEWVRVADDGKLDRHVKLADWCLQSGPGVLVISRGLLSSIEQKHGPLRLTEIAAVQGLNPDGQPMELVALTRSEGRR